MSHPGPARRRFLAIAPALAASVCGAVPPVFARTVVEHDAQPADRFVAVPARDATPPPLALADLAGKQHELAGYRGRVVLLNFWATWCAPCLAEMPALQGLQARFADRPFTVLTINYGESVTRVRKFVEQLDLELPVLLDAFHQVRHDWKVRLLPTSFLIDARGRLRYIVRGELDWASAETVARVGSLID